jgi:hypothetical protein
MSSCDSCGEVCESPAMKRDAQGLVCVVSCCTCVWDSLQGVAYYKTSYEPCGECFNRLDRETKIELMKVDSSYG